MCLAFTIYELLSSIHAGFQFPASLASHHEGFQFPDSLASLHAGFKFPAPILVVLASHHADFHSLRLYCLAYHFIIQASSFRLTIQSSDPFSFPITHNHAHSVYPSRVHLILHDSHIFTHSVLCSQRVPRRAILTPHSPFHFVSSHLFIFICAHRVYLCEYASFCTSIPSFFLSLRTVSQCCEFQAVSTTVSS